MQRAYRKVAGQYPNTPPVSVEPRGLLGRIFGNPEAAATVNPFNPGISYNPIMGTYNPEQQENILAHELAHVRQAQTTPWYKTVMNIINPAKPPAEYPNANPYYWQPHEMEAFQVERERGGRDPITGHGDIELPIDTGPSQPLGSPMFRRRK